MGSLWTRFKVHVRMAHSLRDSARNRERLMNRVSVRSSLAATVAIALALTGCRNSPEQGQLEPVLHKETDEFWLCGSENEEGEWECEEGEQDFPPPEVSKIAVPDPDSDRGEIDLTTFLSALEQENALEAEENELVQPETEKVIKLVNPPYRSLAHFIAPSETLMDLPGDYLVVEIASSDSRDVIDEFLRSSTDVVRDLVEILLVEKEGDLHYVVLLGIYRDRNRADVAALSYRYDTEGGTTKVVELSAIQAGVLSASARHAEIIPIDETLDSHDDADVEVSDQEESAETEGAVQP